MSLCDLRILYGSMVVLENEGDRGADRPSLYRDFESNKGASIKYVRTEGEGAQNRT